MRFWYRWEALEEAICLVDAIGLNCVIQRAKEEKASSSQGRLDLEGFLLFMYSNLFSTGSIYRLEGGKEFFRRVLRFPL